MKITPHSVFLFATFSSTVTSIPLSKANPNGIVTDSPIYFKRSNHQPKRWNENHRLDRGEFNHHTGTHPHPSDDLLAYWRSLSDDPDAAADVISPPPVDQSLLAGKGYDGGHGGVSTQELPLTNLGNERETTGDPERNSEYTQEEPAAEEPPASTTEDPPPAPDDTTPAEPNPAGREEETKSGDLGQ